MGRDYFLFDEFESLRCAGSLVFRHEWLEYPFEKGKDKTCDAFCLYLDTELSSKTEDDARRKRSRPLTGVYIPLVQLQRCTDRDSRPMAALQEGEGMSRASFTYTCMNHVKG